MIKKKQVYSKPFSLVYEKNYPNMFLGPGIYNKYTNAKNSSPKQWIKQNTDSISKERSKQIFSFKKYTKDSVQKENKDLEELQYLAQAYRTTEMEVDLDSKQNKIKESFSGIDNKAYNLEKFKIIDNIRIPRVIDRTVNDTDLKAREGILQIYNRLKDVYKIEQILSVGLLGVKKNRILVPTRWAITGVDDIISKDSIKEKLYYNPIIDSFEIYKHEFFKNKFYIILMPYNWGFEQIEGWQNNLCIDYELNKPKKDYATQVTGGYYAGRLEVTNFLKQRKKQARVLILREIEPDYKSQGVWVIRESVREAFTKKPIICEDLNSAIKCLKLLGLRNTDKWINSSNIVKDLKIQKRLFEFL